MKEYILSLTDSQFENIMARWAEEIGFCYDSKQECAEQLENDPCWLDWQQLTGGTPAQYMALI